MDEQTHQQPPSFFSSRVLAAITTIQKSEQIRRAQSAESEVASFRAKVNHSKWTTIQGLCEAKHARADRRARAQKARSFPLSIVAAAVMVTYNIMPVRCCCVDRTEDSAVESLRDAPRERSSEQASKQASKQREREGVGAAQAPKRQQHKRVQPRN